MQGDAKGFREVAATFKSVADAADRVADAMERNAPGAEVEEALKDFVWQSMKMKEAK